MPSNDPIRLEWIELASHAGWPEPVRQLERYYNGGFVALEVKHRVFLDHLEKGNGTRPVFGR